jgi:hypothetical protein
VGDAAFVFALCIAAASTGEFSLL